MKTSPLAALVIGMGAAAFVVFPAAADACSACMGDVNSRTAPATNDAIFLMLGVIALMFSSLAAFAFYLFKRSRDPLSAHVEAAESVPLTNDSSTVPHGA